VGLDISTTTTYLLLKILKSPRELTASPRSFSVSFDWARVIFGKVNAAVSAVTHVRDSTSRGGG